MRRVTSRKGSCHWAESISWFYAESFDRISPKSFPDDPGQGVFTCQKESRTLYPYDRRTQAITLPKEVERQLRRLVADGNKVEAIRQVTRLTGAGLRVSKDYVDRLAWKDRSRTTKRHWNT